jgi:hypothetical protein
MNIENDVTLISVCFTRYKLNIKKTHNYVTNKQLIERFTVFRKNVIGADLVTKIPNYVTRRS